MDIEKIKKGTTIYVVPNVVSETPSRIAVGNHVRIDKYSDVEVQQKMLDNIIFLYTDKRGVRVLMTAKQSDIFVDVSEVLQVVAGYLKEIRN
jgi:hypothetical protein